MPDHATTSRTGWLSSSDCRIEDLAAIVEQPTDAGRYPSASAVSDGVLIYRCDQLGPAIDGQNEAGAALMAELADAFLNGPGIVVFQGAIPEEAVDQASEAFRLIIADQHRTNTVAGDHFAKPGANDRIWNALEKLALRDPRAFVDYYRNQVIALVSEAWLGPGYQVTSQVNVVNPGGEAQQPHRDYHLGFMTDQQAEQFPRHIHHLSPALTLQGAVAHCAMPIETGPTLYLPHSQKYDLGYLAWRQADFIDYFDQHHVQLPLAKGDAVFFNPALFHAAGTNRTTEVRRMANLLQVSSAMGRAMEKIDRLAMCRAIYPVLVDSAADGMGRRDLDRVIAASAEGYPFPADLDHDQPTNGLAPASQADLVGRALAESWTEEQLHKALSEQARTRTS